MTGHEVVQARGALFLEWQSADKTPTEWVRYVTLNVEMSARLGIPWMSNGGPWEGAVRL